MIERNRLIKFEEKKRNKMEWQQREYILNTIGYSNKNIHSTSITKQWHMIKKNRSRTDNNDQSKQLQPINTSKFD